MLLFLKIGLILHLFFANYPHPLHVSVTNIEYNQEKKTFDVAFKIFTDDFETIIFNKYGVELKLGKEDELQDYEKYINQYVFEHFCIEINEKNKKLRFKHKKMNDIDVWLYYEFSAKGHRRSKALATESGSASGGKNKENIKFVAITNSLMCDLYKDQTNLVIFNYFDIQKGFSFDYNNNNVIFEIISDFPPEADPPKAEKF